jgi:hypothetical protein
VASERDSRGAGGGRLGRRGESGRGLGCMPGTNGCKAFLFARHVSQVARTLLPGFEASLRNEESGSFLTQ